MVVEIWQWLHSVVCPRIKYGPTTFRNSNGEMLESPTLSEVVCKSGGNC